MNARFTSGYERYGVEIQDVKCGKAAGREDPEECEILLATTHYSAFSVTESEEDPAKQNEPDQQPPLSTWLLLFMMFCVLILLGMFMDATSMMLITVPIFFPLAGALGFDLIWYGLFVLITIEMAGTTPPFGLLLYVMLGVAPKGTTLIDVAKAAFPFLVCDTILILILVAWPNLALWLPGLM